MKIAPIQLPIKFRNFMKWAIRLFALTGIVVGFVSFPPYISGILGIVLAAIVFLLERFHFIAQIIHVMPLPSNYLLSKRLGSTWGVTEYKGKDMIFFGQLFETKKAAREAYQLFKSWNFDKYIDTEGNIVVRIVREDLDRYTILLLPGNRGVDKYWEERSEDDFGKRVSTSVSTIKYWFITHADYWGRPQMLSIIESLREPGSILLNAFYMKNGEVESAAKRHLVISNIVFRNRQDLRENDIEFHLDWDDPWTGMTRKSREKFEPLFQKIEQSQAPHSEG